MFSLSAEQHNHARTLRAARVIVFCVCIASFAVRMWLWQSGPDTDSDAYGHMASGAAWLQRPLDTRVHWVWLPLWHVVCAAAIKLGGGHQALRVANALLASLLPAMLAALMLRAQRPPMIAAFAALLSVSGAFLLDHGQSAEPEPLFAALLLGAALAWQSGRVWAAAACFAATCMLRYEAWAFLPAVCAFCMRERKPWGHAAWGVPVAAIALWCAARAHDDGGWFIFVQANRDFVRSAHAHGVGLAESFWRALQLYTLRIPFLEWGPIFAVSLLGIHAFCTHTPRSFLWPAASLLAFITYGWFAGQHLGLPRHMFALAPAFAWLMAEGAARASQRKAGALLVAGAMLFQLGWRVPHALARVQLEHVHYAR